MMGLVSLSEKQESAFVSTEGRCEKVAIHKPGSEPSSRTKSHLDLGPPLATTARNQCLLFKPPDLQYFVLAA